MNKKFLGLGTNIGERKKNLSQAIGELRKVCSIEKISPIFETPALINEQTKSHWDKPFLNIVIEIKSEKEPFEFLELTQAIEKKMGRSRAMKWAPRVIDIDILVWDSLKLNNESLNIPHQDLYKRSFVLDPLAILDSRFLNFSRVHRQHSPLWMAIINITPDSFSDQNQFQSHSEFVKKILEYDDMGVHIFDLGAESTRPGATRINIDQEWKRLKPYLKIWNDQFQKLPIRPLLSIDTYKSQIAEAAVELGVDIINDVSGLEDPLMIKILQNSEVSYILTHSLGIPADPEKVIKGAIMPEICDWLERKLELFEKKGISTERIFFDPGIGFGKNSFQSIEVIKNLDQFNKYQVRLLVGHSRKSFMKGFSSEKPVDRDIETLGISFDLIDKGVDIIRVHNPEIHVRALRARQYVAG